VVEQRAIQAGLVAPKESKKAYPADTEAKEDFVDSCEDDIGLQLQPHSQRPRYRQSAFLISGHRASYTTQLGRLLAESN
jgi:hypothetical protein